MDEERFERQRRFVLEVDKEKLVARQTHIHGMSRRENDAEHAWHLAIMAWLLREYSNADIDIARTMMMVLIHDVVEIDAGDVYAYDTSARAAAEDAERAAADRIYSILPTDQAAELRAIWDEFEADETPEARFAHAMDNLQPMLLTLSNDGADWEEHAVRRSQVGSRNEVTRLGSELLAGYMDERLDEAQRQGHIQPDEGQDG